MADLVKPKPRQIEYQAWELGLFLHFGIRTFYEGHRDWDGKPMSPEKFNPTKLDCSQWAETAAAAGFKYAVMTAKHHDGFANWPSKHTGFSVASSPWKRGRGDVVREYVEAFKKHGLAVGLYYSPAEWGGKVDFHSDPRAYDDYFISQVTELIEPYGPIDILWFDGAGSGGHKYDWPRIVGEIRRLQPNILLFGAYDPDIRWIGNEDGLASTPVWNVVDRQPWVPEDADTGWTPRWLPAECDCRMRRENWFYSDEDEHTVKSLDVLMGMYYYSVGRGCNLLLNIGPDRRGLLPEKDAARLVEFGREIKRRFSGPVATFADIEKVGDGVWEYKNDEPFTVDHVVVQEDIARGEHVRRFAIEFDTYPKGCIKPVVIYEGRNIGHKVVCRFPTVEAGKITLRVTESDGAVTLRNMELFDSAKAGMGEGG